MWCSILRNTLYNMIITAVIVALSCSFGMVTAYRSLEYAKFTEVIDEKEEVRISLALGPFRYVINVPERREGKVTP